MKQFCLKEEHRQNSTQFDNSFDPLDPYGECDAQFKEFLNQPTWNRHGVPGLGLYPDTASWNSVRFSFIFFYIRTIEKYMSKNF